MARITGELENVSEEGYTWCTDLLTIYVEHDKIVDIEFYGAVSPTVLNNSLYEGRLAYKSTVKSNDIW